MWRPPEHLWTSEKPQKQATVKEVWVTFSTNIATQLPELLVNVYSYHGESVSCCCHVRGGAFSQIQSHIDIWSPASKKFQIMIYGSNLSIKITTMLNASS